jgi:exodeoxyribonuclease V alpha subunit
MPYSPHGKSDFYFFQKSDSEEILKILEELILQKIPIQFGIPSSDIQVLTPMRKGDLGYENLNQHLQLLFNSQGEILAEVGPYTIKKGDRVMQIKNNYDKEVFNGDIGFIVGKDGSDVIVDFMDNIVYYEPKDLKELTLAYAISVHKSQGSEYPCVIVPIVPQHTILLRKNLVYTAMTRGMKLVIFVGEKRSLSYAIHKTSTEKRYSGFLKRLMGLI